MSKKREKPMDMDTEFSEMMERADGAELLRSDADDALTQRIAKLESRLDWLYRWTLSDRNGHKYYSPAFTERAKDDRFPLPDYDAPGGPRKPQREP